MKYDNKNGNHSSSLSEVNTEVNIIPGPFWSVEWAKICWRWKKSSAQEKGSSLLSSSHSPGSGCQENEAAFATGPQPVKTATDLSSSTLLQNLHSLCASLQTSRGHFKVLRTWSIVVWRPHYVSYFIHLILWLHCVLVAACNTFVASCGSLLKCTAFSSWGMLASLPLSMWDLGSLIRDRTHVVCIGRQILTTGAPEKSLRILV